MTRPSIHASLRLLLLTMLTATAGCGSLSKPYPDKSLHAIAINDLPAPSTTKSIGVVKVEATHIAPPFDGNSFVYKTGATQYAFDYYAGFISPPDRMVTGVLSAWLAQSGVFSSVISGNSGADYRWAMESNISALYGDYTAQPPTAVIEMKFFLIDESAGEFRVRLEKLYREAEPIAAANPNNLVDGWNKAFRKILVRWTHDLAQFQEANLASTAPPTP